MMKLMPPPLPSRMIAMAAARRRNWSFEKIGFALSISHQAVQQSLSRYERYHGEVSAKIRRTTLAATKVMFKCKVCGSAEWLNPRLIEAGFCSKKCHGLSQRYLSKNQIIWAIDRRIQTADTWTGLSKILKTDVQTIQRNIWIFLAENDLLTNAVVRRIWQPSQSLFVKRGRWKWLVDRTGIEPKKSGRGKLTWGTSNVDI